MGIGDFHQLPLACCAVPADRVKKTFYDLAIESLFWLSYKVVGNLMSKNRPLLVLSLYLV